MSDRRERQRNRDTQRDFIFRTRQEGRLVQSHRVRDMLREKKIIKMSRRKER